MNLNNIFHISNIIIFTNNIIKKFKTTTFEEQEQERKKPKWIMILGRGKTLNHMQKESYVL